MIVVTLLGTLRDQLLAGLVQQLEASIGGRPVIVDLSQITLVSEVVPVVVEVVVAVPRSRPAGW